MQFFQVHVPTNLNLTLVIFSFFTCQHKIVFMSLYAEIEIGGILSSEF